MLTNRYNKFRIYLSWKFPHLYHFVSAIKFPIQLLGLSLAMIAAVSIYNAHYSFAATAKNAAGQTTKETTKQTTRTSSDPILASTNITTNGPEVLGKTTGAAGNVFDNTANSVVTTQAVQTPVENLPPAELEDTLSQSEDALQQQVQKAEVLLRNKKQQTQRLEAKVERAKNLLRASEQTPSGQTSDPLADPATELELYTAEWLQNQPENHYVVQVAAASEQQLLEDYAHNKNFKAPLVIYPFKVNKNGELVYGLSTGLFIVQDDAITELPVLSELSAEHGVWVRKVADIKTQLLTLKRDRIVE